jgi:hypothetical protein
MNSIDLAQYAAHFPTAVGESVRINHCKQGEGKRKFYLTRKANGVVGYCHHCGGSGFSGTQQTLPLEVTTETTTPNKQWSSQNWQDFSTAPFQKLAKEIRVWWFKAGLNVSEYNRLGVKVKNTSSLSIPLFDKPEGLPDRGVTGVATRHFKENFPKWMIDGSKVVFPFTQADDPANLLVLTEDYLSAVRCSRHCYALPLMGTSLSSRNFKDVLSLSKSTGCKVLVWLDNDSPLVIQKAKEIQESVANIVNCGIILLTREAKHYRNDKDLLNVLKI